MLSALARQRQACITLGSPMYVEILGAMIHDYETHGSTYRLLHGSSERPTHDAIPLRALAGLHRIVLEGREARLSALYPSVGGRPDATLATAVLDACESHHAELRYALTQQLQTNEPGRAVAHVALTHWLAMHGIHEFCLLEIGASAGLTMSFDKYGIDMSSRLSPDSAQFHIASAPAMCMQRRGVDINPIDIHDDANVTRLLSFVWPDQLDRFKNLRHAIDIARTDRHIIDQASGDAWLEQQLHGPRQYPTLVFHSIVWQYLGASVQDKIRTTLHQAGARSDRQRPLIWARMEPNGPMADVRATVWNGDTTTDWLLADVGYHGEPFRWINRRIAAT